MLMESLINNHPFVDCNKRTGLTAAAMFLRINGYRLAASNEQVQSFTLSIAIGEASVEPIAEWLKSYLDTA